MKIRLLLLLVVALFLTLPRINKAEQRLDSLNPCWKLVLPNEPDKGIYNPDSVMYDSCLCLGPPINFYKCEFTYAKQWFEIHLPFRALYIPELPSDTIVERNWQDIDSNFIELRKGFEELEKQFGKYIIRKLFPDDIDSTTTGGRAFEVKFENYVKIDTVVNYIITLHDIDDVQYLHNYGEILGDITLDNFQETPNIKIQPNPTLNTLNLKINNDYKEINIEIYNILSILINRTNIKNYNSNNIITINVENLSSGVYCIIINNKLKQFFFINK